MNPVSHALVAREVNPKANDAYIFGAMAPDFIKMAGTRRIIHPDHEDLEAGVAMHLATDRVFDSRPAFMDLQAQVMSELSEFLPRKAAKAAAHIAIEMLLDGFTIQKMEATETLSAAMEAAAGRAFPLGQLAVDPELFMNYIDSRVQMGLPYFYQDPQVVADRLHRRMEGRPSAFSQKFVDPVAEVLTEQQTKLAVVANELLTDTIDQLKREDSQYTELGPVLQLLPDLMIAVRKVKAIDLDSLTTEEFDELHRAQGINRRTAYASGRFALRAALTSLGWKNHASITRGDGGEPVLPEGYVGSISHSNGWAAVACSISGKYSSIGIDIEPSSRSFKHDILDRIGTEKEHQDFQYLGSRAGLFISSAKEAAYKAMYPYTRRHSDFKELELIRVNETELVAVPKAADLVTALEDKSLKVFVLDDQHWLTSVCIIK